MKIFKLTFLLFLFSVKVYSQNIDSLQKKFVNKVCNCIGHIDNYNALKPSIDKCYDSTINFIFSGASPEEIKFYLGKGNLQLLVERFEYNLKSTCPAIVKVINEYVKPRTRNNNYPINFNNKTFELVKKDLKNWSTKTISFEGKIINIDSTNPNKKYLKVELDTNQFIWVGDMTNNPMATIGNKIRFLGYIIDSDKSHNITYHEFDYFIVSFASLEINSNKLLFYPGSEKQIYLWANGKVPTTQK